MKVINTTDHVVYLNYKQGDSPRIEFGPGDIKEVPDFLVAARRWRNGSRRPSLMEDLAPQLRPASQEDYDNWRSTPDYQVQQGAPYIPSFNDLVKRGTPPAIARHMVEAALEKVKADLDKQTQSLVAEDKKPRRKAE